jgi:hypothetical protein
MAGLCSVLCEPALTSQVPSNIFAGHDLRSCGVREIRLHRFVVESAGMKSVEDVVAVQLGLHRRGRAAAINMLRTPIGAADPSTFK